MAAGGGTGLAQPFGDEIFAGHAHKTSDFARFAATAYHRVPVVLRAPNWTVERRVADSDIRLLGRAWI